MTFFLQCTSVFGKQVQYAHGPKDRIEQLKTDLDIIKGQSKELQTQLRNLPYKYFSKQNNDESLDIADYWNDRKAIGDKRDASLLEGRMLETKLKNKRLMYGNRNEEAVLRLIYDLLRMGLPSSNTLRIKITFMNALKMKKYKEAATAIDDMTLSTPTTKKRSVHIAEYLIEKFRK